MKHPDHAVLLVDDDLDIREALTDILEDRGFHVTSAANGREALTVLRSGNVSPSAILLDLMMPVMDGFQFLAEMRKVPEWREIPVIVVTAKDLTKDERLVLNGYVESVLVKGSSELNDLLGEIGRLLPASIERRRRMAAVATVETK